jgi:P-type Cu2+ transporter
MKTSTIEVGGLVSTLSAAGLDRQIASLPGVHHVDVNYVAGSATVHYDESQTSLEAIRQRVVECGYHCRGELVPAHICDPAGQRSDRSQHAGKPMPDSMKGMTATAGAADRAPKAPGHSAHSSHAGKDAGQDPHAAHRASAASDKADMMHDMGHTPGMSMQDMVTDMRNRFFVALLFAIPVFVYSPMGAMLGDFSTPFGLDRKVFLFIVATCGIAYPAWPFFVAAWRAARSGVANMATLIVLSVGTGYVFSVGATFLYEGEVFYEAVVVLLVFILLDGGDPLDVAGSVATLS